jgi:hypothetical protein
VNIPTLCAVGSKSALISFIDGLYRFRDVRIMKGALLVVLMLASRSLAVDITWELISPHTISNDLFSVTFGSGKFVASGNSGIVYSEDAAETWRTARGTKNELYPSVAFGNSKFVAVSSSGAVLVSTNARTWFRLTPAGAPALTSIAFGNGAFVAAGLNGYVGVSTNGTDWTFTKPGIGVLGGDVVFGNGKFVINERSQTLDWRSFLTSSNGAAWTQYRPVMPAIQPPCLRPPCPVYEPFRAFTYAAGKFVVLADYGYPGNMPGFHIPIFASDDGVHFQQVATQIAVQTAFSANDTLFTYCGTCNDTDTAATRNFTNWTYAKTSFARSAAYGANTFVIVGGVFIFRGFSPESLQRYLPPTSANLIAIAKSSATIVGLDNADPSSFLVSTNNGQTFAPVPTIDSTVLLRDLTYADGYFIAVGNAGAMWRSTDGFNWAKLPSLTSGDLNSITFGGGAWIAVSAIGKIFASDRNLVFSEVGAKPYPLHSVLYNDQGFTIVGAEGTIFTSSNTTNWEFTRTGNSTALESVAFGNDRFVATGENGFVSTWRAGAPLMNTNIAGATGLRGLRVAFHRGVFVALDALTSNAFISSDGLNWQPSPLPHGSLNSIDVSDDSLWVAGNSAVIWRAKPLVSNFAAVITSGQLKTSIDVELPGKYRIFRTTDLSSQSWEPRDLLDILEHADWTEPDPLSSAAFYAIKPEL